MPFTAQQRSAHSNKQRQHKNIPEACLAKKHVAAKMIIYQKGGHGFAGYNQAEDDHWIGTAVNWMKLNSF
ncbi:MAG: hypothetical protein EOO88_24310 [Pedobacter sp.]|nr:MAG: hypothetical protein EOO88_24310 [Pedobacter sp.]